MTPLLINAARAFAMVAFADGRLTPVEAGRFAAITSRDRVFANFGHAEIADAWTQASGEVHAAQSFGTALVTIRTEITQPADKAVLMRVAQLALVADGKLEAQENVAISALAEALGLDPKNY
jgi:tellurite resistance protein